MELDPLTAISPIDGRYRERTRELSRWFSEQALMRYRLRVELDYFQFLCELPLPELKDTPIKGIEKVRQRPAVLSTSDAQRIKDIEKVTNHDVKAIEYFLKERLEEAGLGEQREFVHFALTSQDINNTATPLMLKEGMNEVIYPALDVVLALLKSRAEQWKEIPMLARTHGQPASPTRLGKELQVFVKRLENQLALVAQVSGLYAPTAPGPDGIPGLDKVAHFLAFAAPTFLAWLLGARWVVLLLVAHALVAEPLQHALAPTRAAELGDAVANVLGVGVGALAAMGGVAAACSPPSGRRT